MIRHPLFLAAVLSIAVCAQTAAARESAPPVGTPRPFALPAKQEFSLANGLAVTLVPFATVPKATLLVTVRTGNVADGSKTGLADLVAGLMKEGAGTRDTAGVARLAAEMGGGVGIGAGPDQMTVSLDVLAEHLPGGLALLADVVRRPRLPAAELPRLKADLKRQIAVERSQPQGIAGEAYAKLLWGDSVYGRGTPSDAVVDSMTIEDVRHFVKTEFGAARTHIFIAGRFDTALVEHTVRRLFGDWSAGPPPRHETVTGSRARVVRLIDRPGAAQSTVILGLPVRMPGSPGFMRLSMANALLGGSGLLSRLDQNLREEKGYTYGASSHISPNAGGAAWTLATDVNAPDTAKAIAEIYRELARLRTEPPPAAELLRIRNFRAGNFVLGASSRGGLLGQLAFLDLHGLPDSWLTNYVQRLGEVTPESLRDAAAESLDPAAMTLVVVGDLAKIRQSLQDLEALKGAEFR